MNNTSINWTDYSSNLIRARRIDNGKVGHFCTHKNEKCRNCYAEAINKRFGTGLDYKPQNREKIEFFFAEKEAENLRRMNARLKKSGETRKIFLSSMTDLFHETMPFDLIDEVYAVIASCQNLIFQVLTKRADVALRYFEYLEKDFADAGTEFVILPNLWFGLTPEDDGADIPKLREIPAAVRWLSLEPLLMDLLLTDEMSFVDWIVCGGESGLKARPFNLQWARHLKNQCDFYGIFLWFKQTGNKPYQQHFHDETNGEKIEIKVSGKGEDIEEFPEDLRVREFPK